MQFTVHWVCKNNRILKERFYYGTNPVQFIGSIKTEERYRRQYIGHVKIAGTFNSANCSKYSLIYNICVYYLARVVFAKRSGAILL